MDHHTIVKKVNLNKFDQFRFYLPYQTFYLSKKEKKTA